ncbi:MAG: hypothetical protein IRZ05_20675 [Micromonosporaceae bacterium]|nr:hypothetical protein [Micromonosporaceae bacterium]
MSTGPPRSPAAASTVRPPVLSGRQWAVARLVALGMSDAAIAVRLGVSVATVSQAIAAARRAAWVPDRIGLIAWVWEWTAQAREEAAA